MNSLLYIFLLALAVVRRTPRQLKFASNLAATIVQAASSVAMTQDEENVEPKPKDGYLESALDYYKGVVANHPENPRNVNSDATPLGENQGDYPDAVWPPSGEHMRSVLAYLECVETSEAAEDMSTHGQSCDDVCANMCPRAAEGQEGQGRG